MAKAEAKGEKSPLRKWGWRAAKVLLGFVVGIHLYALALKFVPVPGTILMTQQALGGVNVRRDSVPLSEISPHLVRAVIASEDTKFCEHNGIDRAAIDKALEDRKKGKKLRGASTITQQTAKNTFLWNGGGFVRKGAEAYWALFIDQIWGKRRVMEAYLNIAEFGDGLFGAEAAAQARFGKPAKDLTEREAALLATILPSPNKWRVDPPGPYVSKRAGTVQSRMRVVQSQGLDLCVLEKGAKGAAPPAPKTPTTAPEPEPPPVEMPELPDLPPDYGDVVEAAPPAPVDPAADEDLNAVLDAVDESFAAPEDEAIPETVTPEEVIPEEPTEAASAPIAEGPTPLVPRDPVEETSEDLVDPVEGAPPE